MMRRLHQRIRHRRTSNYGSSTHAVSNMALSLVSRHALNLHVRRQLRRPPQSGFREMGSFSSSRGGCRRRDLLELDTADWFSRRCNSARFVSSAICVFFSAACAISTAFLAMSLSFLRPSKLCDAPLPAENKALELALLCSVSASKLRGGARGVGARVMLTF
jgi:hypothetical protein